MQELPRQAFVSLLLAGWFEFVLRPQNYVTQVFWHPPNHLYQYHKYTHMPVFRYIFICTENSVYVCVRVCACVGVCVSLAVD